MLKRFARPADAWLFVALVLASAALSLTAVAGSLARVGRVFPGFVVWDDLMVAALGPSEWTGVAARVPYRAHVVAVDGRPVATRADVDAILRPAGPGAPHRYAFEGPAGREERTVAAMVLSAADWTATSGVYVLNGLAFLVVGLAVFWLKPESPQSRAMLAFGTVWGLTLVLAVDVFGGGRFESLYFVLQGVAPATILHLALVFPENRLRSARVLLPAYAAGLAAGGVEAWAFRHSWTALLALDNATYLALAAATIFALASIARAVFRAATPLARRRARVVLAGAVVAFLIPVVALLAFLLLAQPVSFSLLTLTGFVFPLAIGYAIARHDLFEADRFVKLSLVYAGLTALVSAGYAGTVLVADRLAAGLPVVRSPAFPVVFTLVALATIAPLRDRVQRAVDRLFYRSRVDYKRAVAAASERMTTLLDRSAIADHVAATARAVVFSDAAIWERDGDGLVRRTADEARLCVSDAVARVLTRRAALSRDAVEESPGIRGVRDALRALFDGLGATLVVPLLRRGELVGVLAVGRKASGSPLSADDVDVLRTLAHEATVALANAAAIEELRKAHERLRVSERLAAMGELAAAVAHGIRNPLAGIRLTAQLGLEEVAADHPVRENLEDVVLEVDKLERQVRGILDFTRPFEPRLEPTDVRRLLDSLLQTLGPRVDAARVAVAVETAPGLPRVAADRMHLAQALQELFANALDAMPDGGRLTITANAAGEGRPHVRIAVADTGPGVPPEMRERIFQLFTTTRATGTGVGLAVARKIVERHGGRIAVEPVEPRGACFVVELPLASVTDTDTRSG